MAPQPYYRGAERLTPLYTNQKRGVILTMFAKKKRVELVGSLEYPLAIGNAAFIKEASGLRRTSTVQHFIQMPSGVIQIETTNTRYVLRPPEKAAAKGVRV